MQTRVVSLIQSNIKNFTISIWILLFVPHGLISAVFNADEIKLMNYEVDILSSPIKANQEHDLPVLQLMSKYGQQYHCLLPQPVQSSEEGGAGNKDAGQPEMPLVQDLLKPLQSGPCLIKPKDWWTYELCVGQHIRQYHIEDSQISGPSLNLGVFDSDYDWNNLNDKNDFSKLKQTRYHSQLYVNGSHCDLTGKPRTTEVRFYCEIDAGDYISRVDEPETCRYIMTVHTHRVCSHPYLKPAPSTKPHTIQCNPVLEEEPYAKYLQRVQEEQEKAQQKHQEWIKQQQKQLEELKLRLQQQKEKQKLKMGQAKVTELEEAKVENEEEEDDSLTEYDKTLQGLSAKEQLQLASNKNSLKDLISKEFSAIIQEAEEELKQELEDDSREAAYSELANTLNRLISKLDKAEEQVAQLKSEGDPDAYSKLAVTLAKLGKAEKEVAKATEHFKQVQDKINKIQAEKEEIENNEQEEEEEEEENKDISEDDESKLMPDFDNKVRVRIRKVDSGSKMIGEDGKVQWFRQKDLDQGQKLRLEEAVKDKLEQAGLDSSGRRIEVKIITAGYYNDEEDGKTYHVLTDEETQQFQNMILTLLTGSQEARREIERQRQMEKNYQFVWGEDEITPEDTEDR